MARNHRRVTANAKSESKEESAPKHSVKVFVEQMQGKLQELLRKHRNGMKKYVNVLEIDCGVVRLTDFQRYLKEFFKSIDIKKPTYLDSDEGHFYQGSNDKFTVGAGLQVDCRNQTQVFMYVNRL